MEIVEGFCFESENQAAKARKEAGGIKYIKENTRMDDPEVVLKLYSKLIQDNMLTTPVGVAFLIELQEFLMTSTNIDKEYIRPIPAEMCNFDTRTNRPQSVRENARNNTNLNRKVNRTKKVNQNVSVEETGKKHKVSVWLNVILIVIIVGMFMVNYLTGNSVNVFNYENALIDKYESWENNLKEREAAIREKENELGIEYTDDVDDETVEAE